MAEIDDQAKEALTDVRKVGANYEEHQQETGLDIPVDLVHFKKFPVVDPPGQVQEGGPRHSVRHQSGGQPRTARLQRSVQPEPQVLGFLERRAHQHAGDELTSTTGCASRAGRTRLRSGTDATTCSASSRRLGET